MKARKDSAAGPFQAVAHRKLYVQIADQIRGFIEGGEFKPGRQLPSERDLAGVLGVSRPTVREALLALEIAGLVEVRIGVGAFVAAASGRATAEGLGDHSPLEVIEARLVIEPEVAAMAARALTPEGAARLTAIRTALDGEHARGVFAEASDRLLHETVAELCLNQALAETVARLWRDRDEPLSQRFHGHLALIGSHREHIFGQHVAIIDTVLAGEDEAARAAMRAHLAYVRGEMQAVWE